MKLFEIEQFRKQLRLYINLLGGGIALVYTFFQLFRGEYFAALNTSLSFIYFVFVVYFLIVKKYYLWNGRGFVFLISIVILNIVFRDPTYGIYWVYVGIIGIFLLTDMKSASIGALCFISTALYFANPFFDTPILIRIYSTVIITAILAAIFSYLLENLIQKMKKLIIHDPLTGILNRNSFDESMQEALELLFRYQTPVFMLLFDIDHFKKVNDEHGHQIGDKVLEQICNLVSRRLRQSDSFFRYGGEEFTIILNHTQQAEAIKLAGDIKDVVEQATFPNDLKVTISIGGTAAQKSDTISSWLGRCDKALYEAKATGRNKIVIG